MNELSPIGRAAIAYAQRGWRVFPCRARAKQPLTAHGCRDATTDIARIARYWQRVPAANVAIATGPASGLWALDVDAPDGFDSLSRLESRYGPLPRTLTQRTGGGGIQLFWRWPAGGGIRNSAGRLGVGLDTRGDGGYVVAPPSVHPSGVEYVWLGEDDIAEAPAWLLELLAAPVPAPPTAGGPAQPPAQRGLRPAVMSERQAAGLAGFVAGQSEGNRNQALYWAAHRVREGGASLAEALAILLPAARQCGLGEAEAQRTIQSAFSPKWATAAPAGGGASSRAARWLAAAAALLAGGDHAGRG